MNDSTNPQRIDPSEPAFSGPAGMRARLAHQAAAPLRPAVQPGSNEVREPKLQGSAPRLPLERADKPQSGLSDSGVASDSPPEPGEGGRERWLNYQATELISRLQSWADELDTREARLNVQASLQDSRERQFRLRQNDAAANLKEQRRSIARLRNELEIEARRLAFRDP